MWGTVWAWLKEHWKVALVAAGVVLTGGLLALCLHARAENARNKALAAAGEAKGAEDALKGVAAGLVEVGRASAQEAAKAHEGAEQAEAAVKAEEGREQAAATQREGPVASAGSDVDDLEKVLNGK